MTKNFENFIWARSENFNFKYTPLNQLDKEIATLSKRLKRQIRVADLGAGPAKYWKQGILNEALHLHIQELYLIDALTEFTRNESLDSKIIYENGILPNVLSKYEDDFFDLVIGFDLIEHLAYHDGLKFLYEIDRITKHVSMLYTPNGFLWQPPSKNNIWNAHLSGWTPKQLKKLGWNKIYGHGGIKYYFGPYGLRKKDFNSISLIFHFLLLPFIRIFPIFAFSFSAIKHKKNPRIQTHA